MPFCSHCGKQVGAADAYCAKCGARQPVAATPPSNAPASDPLASINPRTASVLCYVPGLGWIAAIIVLASQRFRQDQAVRFHAFQGLYLFVAWLMADWVFRPMMGLIAPHLHLQSVVQLVLLVASVFMMVKASKDEVYALPLFGELAQRSIVEN